MFSEILIIFLIGCIVGWCIEVVYRTIQFKKVINPGFLKGPYLPVHGMGLVGIYFISLANISLVLKILLFVILTTGVELILGLISRNWFNLELWDYSKDKFNYKGVICPLYSFYWLVLSLAIFFTIDYLIAIVLFISDFPLIVLVIYVLMFIDLIFTLVGLSRGKHQFRKIIS